MFWGESEDLLSGEVTDIETESLQTDIQRFLAIMAFCLMAIFALVQSIPVSTPTEEVVATDFTNQLENQKNELNQLRQENELLKEQIAKIVHQADIEESLERELTESRRLLEGQKERIDKLLTDKVEQQRSLATYRQMLNRREEEIKELQKEKRQIEEVVKKATRAPEVPPVRKEDMKRTEDKAKRRGLYVAFASDKAFMDLLSSGKIRLFISIDKMEQVFEVSSKRGAIDFKSGAPAAGLDLWGVPQDLVPSRIVSAFGSWTTLARRKKMFIVGLASDISGQIRSKDVDSGVFRIGAGGKVTYSEDF